MNLYFLKKVSLFFLIAICIVGCHADDTATSSTATAEPSNIIYASIAQTRTSIGSKVGDIYPVYWSEEDRIVVNGVLSGKVAIDENDPSKATFAINPTPAFPLHITYPYCDATTAEEPVVEFSAEQTYTEGSFSIGAAPMCGYTESSNDVTLSHLASILRFPIKAKNEGIIMKKVVVTADTAIAGKFKVDCQNTTIEPTEQSKNCIVYTLPSNFALSTTEESIFHISLAAVNVGSCKIEFIEESGKRMEATWTPNKPLMQGVVREFKTITYEAKTGVTLQPLDTETDNFEIFYKRVYGHIRYTDGSPIAGVAVSDGFQVVTTDNNGYYELQNVTPESWYIYCSLPSDVEVPIDDLGRPCFFKKYPSNSPCYDFTFERLAGGEEKEFSIFAIADTQPTGNDHLERFRVQAAPEIKAYSKSLGLPCYGMVLGDLVGSVPSLMDDMRSELEYTKMGMPIFTVMGNHDHVKYSSNAPLFPDERNSNYRIKVQRDFEECFGPVNYSFNRGSVHIVGMRNIKHLDNVSVSNFVNGFTAEQFEWLKQDLAVVPKDKMVVLCVHIPILNGGKLGDGNYLQEVLNLMDQYAEAHILSGHTHYMRPYDHAWNKTGHKIYEHCIASTRYDMAASNIHRDGSPCGYAVLKVKNASFVDWYYKGFPYGMNTRDDQMRLYRGASIFGAEPSGENKYGTMGFYQLPFDNSTLLANIFSSDPSWNVEVYEDGVYSGKMTHFHTSSSSKYEELVGDGTFESPRRVADGVVCSRDFWAIGILFGYLGSEVNNNYNMCHTMWRYTLKNPDAKHIEVRATDRFGYVYKEDRIENNSDLGYALYNPEYNPVIE